MAPVQPNSLRLIRRGSKSAAIAPWILLVVLVLLLLWEAIRLDAIALDNQRAHQAPWALGFMGLETTGTLAGGLAALIFARSQFFRQTMPTIGASTRPTPVPGRWRWSAPKDRYTTFLFNAGPGVVRFDSVAYRLGDSNVPETWCHESGFVDKLMEAGLIQDKDFSLLSIGSGAPLAVQARFTEGAKLLEFSPMMRARFSWAEARVRVVDASGNHYERVVPLTRTGMRDSPQ